MSIIFRNTIFNTSNTKKLVVNNVGERISKELSRSEKKYKEKDKESKEECKNKLKNIKIDLSFKLEILKYTQGPLIY